MKLRHFIIIAIVIVLPLTLSFTSKRFAENVRLFSYSVIKPVLQISHVITARGRKAIAELKDYQAVYQENRKLKRELEEERNKTVIETEVLQENARLRKLLGFKKEVFREVVPAQIIARDISYWSRWIVLDKGIDDGITPGMVLVSDQGLVGRVVSAGKHIARAILIIDGESRVSVIVQTTRDTGLLEGRGDNPLMIRLLPTDAKIKKGDAVITSGLGGSYPKGLPVGTILDLTTDKDGLHQSAAVKSFVDFNKLEEVLCLNTTALN